MDLHFICVKLIFIHASLSLFEWKNDQSIREAFHTQDTKDLTKNKEPKR